MNKKQRLRKLLVAMAGVGFVGGFGGGLRVAVAGGVTVVRAAKVYVGDGQVVEGGAVLIDGGRITSVGTDVDVPNGARVIEVAEGSITPGLIDASAWVEPSDMFISPVVHADAFVDRILHGHNHNHRSVGCCGSTCPKFYLHADGSTCPICGFPNKAPTLAVGVHSFGVRAEESSEVIPHTRVIDSVNLRSADFARLARGGVTTTFVSPDTAAVISARGAVVRTGGAMSRRVIREADAVLAAMGSDPVSRGVRNSLPSQKNVTFNTRRPWTRMGVTWVFRKAMYDTKRSADGIPVGGADTPSLLAMATLRDVMTGAVPLRIHARTQHDILAALRLSDEFGLPFVLVEATEAYLCLDELKAKNVPVVFGPIYVDAPGYRGFTAETRRNRLNTFKALLDAEIVTALTAHELRDEDGLARQVMYAMRNGVTLAQALPAVTSQPAKLLGLEHEVGTIATGKQADLVLWSGEPFAATSAPKVVLIGGEVIVDRRKG